MAEFKKPYDKAYGFWHVTTEGDCEGRSITDLGVFEGNIDTIALALADRCYYYTLYFTAVDPTAYDKAPKKDEINISIYGASGMYDMTKEERLDAMRNMLKDRPVFVRDGDRADTFKSGHQQIFGSRTSILLWTRKPLKIHTKKQRSDTKCIWSPKPTSFAMMIS